MDMELRDDIATVSEQKCDVKTESNTRMAYMPYWRGMDLRKIPGFTVGKIYEILDKKPYDRAKYPRVPMSGEEQLFKVIDDNGQTRHIHSAYFEEIPETNSGPTWTDVPQLNSMRDAAEEKLWNESNYTTDQELLKKRMEQMDKACAANELASKLDGVEKCVMAGIDIRAAAKEVLQTFDKELVEETAKEIEFLKDFIKRAQSRPFQSINNLLNKAKHYKTLVDGGIDNISAMLSNLEKIANADFGRKEEQ